MEGGVQVVRFPTEKTVLLVGDLIPPATHLHALRWAFYSAKTKKRESWRQVIELTSSNMIQLRNLLARLRKERKAGLHCPYFVLIRFVKTCNDLRVLLTQAREYHLTVVLYGGGVEECPDITQYETLSERIIYLGAEVEGAPLFATQRNHQCLLDIPTSNQIKSQATGRNSHIGQGKTAGAVHRNLRAWEERTKSNRAQKKKKRFYRHRTQYVPKPGDNVVLGGGDVGRQEALRMLGLDPLVDHTWDQIRRAWKKIALQHHPDKRGRKSEEEQTASRAYFMQAKHALEILEKEQM